MRKERKSSRALDLHAQGELGVLHLVRRMQRSFLLQVGKED
jgi:hypothetical protein